MHYVSLSILGAIVGIIVAVPGLAVIGRGLYAVLGDPGGLGDFGPLPLVMAGALAGLYVGGACGAIGGILLDRRRRAAGIGACAGALLAAQPAGATDLSAGLLLLIVGAVAGAAVAWITASVVSRMTT